MYSTGNAALDHSLKMLFNSSDTIWVRANVRERLAEIHGVLGSALTAFDAEFKRASVDAQKSKPKKGKK